MHGILLGINGVSPLKYFRKVWPVLTFSFSRCQCFVYPTECGSANASSGRSWNPSPVSPPLSVDRWSDGCAGCYPAMLAVMVAPTVHITAGPKWIATLVGIVTVSSGRHCRCRWWCNLAALIVLPADGPASNPWWRC
ncbi:hypothetical protein ACNKHV_09175 [Shigella flexneri]